MTYHVTYHCTALFDVTRYVSLKGDTYHVHVWQACRKENGKFKPRTTYQDHDG